MSNCSACEELRENYPSLIANGLNSSHCNSLQNDTGLSASKSNDDCEDYELMNDCLIGNMDEEVELIEYCDWKDFMHNLIPNLHTMFKATNCIICGLWKNIHDLWDEISDVLDEISNIKTRITNLEKDTDRIDCIVDYISKGASFSFGESTSDTSSKLVPGAGCDFSVRNGGQQHANDITITYIAGGLGIVSGSVRTFTESFRDGYGDTRSGNSMWNFESSSYDLPSGGELLYELRIKKSEYPQIKRFFNGHAFETGGNDQDFTVNIIQFDGDDTSSSEPTKYAYGQHGWCDNDGSPSESGYSSGHRVPSGWIFVQLRMASVAHLSVYGVKDGSGATKQGTDFSPRGMVGIRMNVDEITC